MTDIMVSMIVAMADNRVIGRDNQLPWYLPNDLKYFKATTLGKPIVMGRKTFESIGRPLPGRANIVVTRDKAYRAEGIKVVHSAEQAIAVAADVAAEDGAGELMVIGGAQLYEELLPHTQRLYLTEVHAEVEGDALFPDFERGQWREVVRESFDGGGPNPYDYSFVVLERRG